MNTSRLFAATGAAALCLMALGTTLPAMAAPSPAPAPTESAHPRTHPAPELTLLSVGDGTARLGYVRGANQGAFLFVHQPDGSVKRCPISDNSGAYCPISITPGVVNHISVRQAAGLTEDPDAPALDLVLDARQVALDAPDVPLITNQSGDRLVIRAIGKPGASVEIKNSNGTVVATSDLPTGNDYVGFSLRSSDATVPTRQFTITQSYAGVTSAPAPFRSDDLTLPPAGDLVAPTVDSITADGSDYFRVVVSTTADQVYLRNGIKVLEKAVAVIDGKAELWIFNPGTERRLTVSATSVVDGAQLESAGTPLVLNEGVGSAIPDQPAVTDVTMSGSRTVVTTTGVPGAVATLRDATGATVAIKKLSGSGTAQLAASVAGRAAGDFSIVQTVAGIESGAATVHLGSR